MKNFCLQNVQLIDILDILLTKIDELLKQSTCKNIFDIIKILNLSLTY